MKLCQLKFPLLFLLIGWPCLPATAQETSNKQDSTKPVVKADSQAKTPAKSVSDLDAIREASREFVEAFNNANAQTLAALWTEDGDYVDEAGHVFTGRAAIEDQYAQFFAEHSGVKMRVVIDSLRLLNGDAAIEDGRAMLEPAVVGTPALSKYTAVHVKVHGKWLMSTVRDERVELPSAYRHLEDLEWLIGTWMAEEHGVTTEAVCRWVANKSFVERRYTVTHSDHTSTSGIQLIGFDPQAGQIQSWNFSSDGGHATGVWSSSDRGWQVKMRGMTGDGTSTTAVNLLTRIDDNAYTWQSVERDLGGNALPDSDEVILKRQIAVP